MTPAPVVLAGDAATSTATAEHGTFDTPAREETAPAVGALDACANCRPAHDAAGEGGGLHDGADRGDPPRGGGRRREACRPDPRHHRHRRRGRRGGGQVRAPGWRPTPPTEVFLNAAVNLHTNHRHHHARTKLDVPTSPGHDG
ncbi:carboxymuconolactone decarboxylase family protein [Streptomyces sp. ISL-111]|uniref:carboxymuconolactone decarboxylase family protein n=1 Tax=Streptomyces sp. ISL-111 TaxID=2819175 RepID=UPI0020362E85|nr:carboxymuconolactone decarboxylase family protein [Streptomyces sp. ISL-111]